MTETLLRIVAAAVVVALAAGLAHGIPRLPGLARLAPPIEEGRVGSLDGLRGILAMGVVLSHAFSYRLFFATGRFDPSPIRPFRDSGKWGVALFFAITGYLFWSRAISRPPPPLKHYRGRFLRIYPLYGALAALSITACLLAAAPIRESAGHLVRVAASVAVFGSGLGDRVNGVPLENLIGQGWTLRFEMVFYLALPAVAFLARRPWTSYGTCAALFAIAAFSPTHGFSKVAGALFAVGMLVATLQGQGQGQGQGKGVLRERLVRRPFAILSLAALAGLFLLPDIYSAASIPLLVLAFAPIAYGNDLFGLLTRPALRSLGEITYSLYMVHNAIQFGLFTLVQRGWSLDSLSEPAFWGLVALTTAPIVAASLVTFHLLERPFFGRRPMPVADAAP